jgi:hypothetical protein
LPIVWDIVVHGNAAYIGGLFDGTQSNTSLGLYGVVRTDYPTTGSGTIDQGFDLGLGHVNIVTALLIDSATDNIYAAGLLGSLSPGQRHAAAWNINSQNHLFDIIITRPSPAYGAAGLALANGKLVIAGSIAEVWDGSVWQMREGVAAFNKTTGALDSWAPNPGPRIYTIANHANISRIWAGGALSIDLHSLTYP